LLRLLHHGEKEIRKTSNILSESHFATAISYPYMICFEYSSDNRKYNTSSLHCVDNVCTRSS